MARPEGHAARAGDARLGPVARAGAVPAVPPGVPPDEVAGVAGLRHRPARRHGLPHPRPRVLGARARAPKTVEATSTHFEPEVASETYPRASIVRYAFPARGTRPPVKLTWYDGRLLPPIPPGARAGPHAARERRAADRRQGQDPARLARGRRRAPDPRDAHAGVQAAAEDAAPGHGRPRGRLDPRVQGRPGRRRRRAPRSSTAARSPRWCCSGVLAIRMKDQRLEWDSANLRFTNNEKANELLHIQYRDGWTL